MIVLNVGTNSVYFTLNEKFDFYSPSVSSYTQSYYVGKLINKLTENEVYFRLNNDTSTAPQRYNRFQLEVTPYNVTSSNQIGLTGFNWDIDSQWNYEIWAVNGSTSSFTFSSIPNGGVILESGRAFVGDGTPIQHDLPGQFISSSYNLDIFWNSVDGENWTINSSPDDIGTSLFLKTNNRLISFNTESGDTTHLYSEWPYQSWTTLTTPLSISKSFAYSSTLNRIVGFELNGSQMIYSDDEGDNWDTISTPNELTCGEIRVVWTGDKFVAISFCSGIGGIVAFSNDGLSWSIETNNIGSYPDEPLDIFSYIEDFGLYYIFKLYGKVLVSSNALNWYDLNDYCPQPVNALSWVCIKSNGLVVVAINSLGDVMTSTDGYEFVVSSTGFTETLSGLSWSPYLGLFVASSIDNTFISSTDGLNWISCSGTADSFSDIIWVEDTI